MKPPFPFYGAKQTIAPRIIALLPEHEHYVEPYAGSLAVLLAKPPAKMETANDLDERVVTFFRVLRDRPHELMLACRFTPHSRAEYARCREPAADELESARRTWVLLTQGRGSPLARATGWKFYIDPDGSGVGMPGYLDGYLDRMWPVAKRLLSVSLECRPGLEVIRDYGGHAKALLFVDPPYVRSTRNGTGYRHEMTDADHGELAEALRACRAAVVLCGYPSTLYRRLYADWNRTVIASATGQGGTWSGREEVLWSNVELAEQMPLFEWLVYD